MVYMMNSNRAYWAQQKFPFKLQNMLEVLEAQGNDHIAAWDSNGTTFRINQPQELVRLVMPFYFNQTKFKSFQVSASSFPAALAK